MPDYDVNHWTGRCARHDVDNCASCATGRQTNTLVAAGHAQAEALQRAARQNSAEQVAAQRELAREQMAANARLTQHQIDENRRLAAERRAYEQGLEQKKEREKRRWLSYRQSRAEALRAQGKPVDDLDIQYDYETWKDAERAKHSALVARTRTTFDELIAALIKDSDADLARVRAQEADFRQRLAMFRRCRTFTVAPVWYGHLTWILTFLLIAAYVYRGHVEQLLVLFAVPAVAVAVAHYRNDARRTALAPEMLAAEKPVLWVSKQLPVALMTVGGLAVFGGSLVFGAALVAAGFCGHRVVDNGYSLLLAPEADRNDAEATALDARIAELEGYRARLLNEDFGDFLDRQGIPRALDF